MDILFLTGIQVSAVISFFFLKDKRKIEIISVSVLAVVFLLSLRLALEIAESGKDYAPYHCFLIDPLGAVMMVLISTIGLAASFYSVYYLRDEVKRGIIGFRRVRQYFILLQLFIAAMLFAVMTAYPALMWIAIEMTTLSTAFLVSFYNSPAAIEAAWKYLMINSVGLLIGFFGTLLYFTPEQTHSGNGFVTWELLHAGSNGFDPFIAKIAFIFVLVGYGTKVGLFPMHTWLPDAHGKAPTPVSALLSGVLLNVAFVALLRFRSVTDDTVDPAFTSQLLIAFGTLSVLLASLLIFNQKNYKRMLAYSSIENMGIIVLAAGLGGAALFAGILHLIYHALVKSMLFLSAGNIFLRFKSTKIINVSGGIQVLPVSSVLFLIGFLTITGTPPFGIFLTKLSILSVGISTHPFLTVIVISAFIILFTGLLRHTSAMVFGSPQAGIASGEKEVKGLLLPPLFLCCILLLLSVYLPAPLHHLIDLISMRYSS